MFALFYYMEKSCYKKISLCISVTHKDEISFLEVLQLCMLHLCRLGFDTWKALVCGRIHLKVELNYKIGNIFVLDMERTIGIE